MINSGSNGRSSVLDGAPRSLTQSRGIYHRWSNLINEYKMKRASAESLFINFFILGLYFVNSYSEELALIGGAFVIIYLAFRAFVTPISAFLLICGVKLTFDILWPLQFSFVELEKVTLLQLFLLPAIILLIRISHLFRRGTNWPVWLAFFYLAWTVAAQLLNKKSFNMELIIRQGGILIGTILGIQCIKNRGQLTSLFWLILISTFVPVFASFFQLIAGQFGISIFRYTITSDMWLRNAGLSYDAGTQGMVNIVSFLCVSYFLFTGRVMRKSLRIFLYFLMSVTILNIISSGTRSSIVVSSLIIIVLLVKYLKKSSLALVLSLMIALVFVQPFLSSVIIKSSQDLMKQMNLRELLSQRDIDTRTMLTGRIGIWQDVWQQYNDGSVLQMLFGAGDLKKNVHSSYFFLLFQIGLFGLVFYILIHLKMGAYLLRSNFSYHFKAIGLLALLSIILLGISLTTVTYTSFQWFIYMIIAGIINLHEINSKFTKVQRWRLSRVS